ncbi:hypothetical protein DQ04_04491030 [Trypanosoma grayi]|uniref:hypothetical protein n=1 Tax=Trypanosoma grayi TaxID=71804 RepID=UPI0004F3F2B5|nr:hypothetical protein DQ04_04491030 [Trypanosoma grayi]KEG09885.1 hypothetical protein DQ04_04491030 [Trypanosoma grayi]
MEQMQLTPDANYEAHSRRLAAIRAKHNLFEDAQRGGRIRRHFLEAMEMLKPTSVPNRMSHLYKDSETQLLAEIIADTRVRTQCGTEGFTPWVTDDESGVKHRYALLDEGEMRDGSSRIRGATEVRELLAELISRWPGNEERVPSAPTSGTGGPGSGWPSVGHLLPDEEDE